MALIKCPECGKDVSSFCNSCPHCGFPLINNKKTDTADKNKWPKPIEPNWVEPYKKKVVRNKLIWSLIFLLVSGFLALCITMLIVDKRVEYYYWSNGTPTSRTYTKTVWIVMTWISVISWFVFLCFWLNTLIESKARIRKYDGYTILVYIGVLKRFLFIENILQDTGVVNRFLYGQLPNKKQVKAAISAWDASVKIGVCEAGDTKYLS